MAAMDDKIRDEKLQCDIIGEAATISALSSGRIDKYEYIIAEKILLSDQCIMKTTNKNNWGSRKKAVEALIVLKPDTQQYETIRSFTKNISPGKNYFR